MKTTRTRPRRPAPASRTAVPKRRATKPRAPGRPRLGADQRAGLLDAALACYVRQGIRGTSIRDIAAEAGVTAALVHYYFGDADALKQQVVEQRLMPVFHTVRGAMAEVDPHDTAALITGFVNAICGAIEQHPWWPALWVREVISEGGSLRDLLLQRVLPEFIRAMAQHFTAAQARGQLNARVDPRLLVVSIVGLTMFPVAGAPIWRQVLDADDLSLDDIRTHALALLADGLMVPS
jgi:AcrR family transcriptional regulator